MINLSAAAALFARTAYSTMHGLTLMIGARRMNAANGLIPNVDVQKKQYETAFLRSLFLCKSSHLRVVTSVLPLNIIKFFPSLSAIAAAHFGCMVGRYFLVMPKTRWNISLNGEREPPADKKSSEGKMFWF